MAFNHRVYNGEFSANPGRMPLAKYGVEVIPAVVAEGESYWRVIGIHHLSPEENMSNRNVFMEALDEQGKRVKNVWAGWTWEGIQGHERADPTPLDKPDEEPAGNISVGSNQKVTVWIKGARDGNDKSDRVAGLHTMHPDERLPDGRLLNSLGHHSFYVVWQRTKKAGTVTPPVVVIPPVVIPPVEPMPGPVEGFTEFHPWFETERLKVQLMITVKGRD